MITITKRTLFDPMVSRLGFYSFNSMDSCSNGGVVKFFIHDYTHYKDHPVLVFLSPDQIKDLIDLLTEAHKEITNRIDRL